LSSLSISGQSLSPAFAAGTTSYFVYVANGVTSVTGTWAASDSAATLGTPSGQTISLSVGLTGITVSVWAQDGTTKKSYAISIYRNGPTPSDYSSANIGTLKGVPTGSFQRDGTPTNISTIAGVFRMSMHEITRSQWTAVMGSSNDPSYTPYSSGNSDPVQETDWYHAIAFCNKLSIAESLTQVYTVTGVNFATLTYDSIPTSTDAAWDAATVNWSANGYRLPTAMEWVWAAVGATGSYSKAFAGSTGSNAIGDYAVFGYGTGDTGATTTQRTNPVGSKLANELGLYDMSGNVSEWCWDWHETGGITPLGTLVSDTTAGRGATTGEFRELRGGSFEDYASSCALWYPVERRPYYQNEAIGFRVVRN
jgi:formylglycine-generating enzyme required for sulfatase activity